MKMLSAVQVAVHSSHHSIQHVARPVTSPIAIRLRVPSSFPTQSQNRFQCRRFLQIRLRPFLQFDQPTLHFAGRFRSIRLPNPLAQFQERLAQMLASVADLQPAVQKAQDDRHAEKQAFPGDGGRLPAIDVDRLGRVFGRNLAGLVAKHAVSRRQFFSVGLIDDLGSETAAGSDSGGDVNLLSIASLVMLVGQEVFGDFTAADGGSDQTEIAEGALEAMPKRRMAAENPGQSPVGNGELAQEQGVFDGRDMGGAVGHDKGRSNGIGSAIGESDAAERKVELGGDATVLEAIAEVKTGRKEFGEMGEESIDGGAKEDGVGDDLVVGLFLEGKTDGMRRRRRVARRNRGHDRYPL